VTASASKARGAEDRGEAGASAHGTFHRHRPPVQLGEEASPWPTETGCLELARQAAPCQSDGRAGKQLIERLGGMPMPISVTPNFEKQKGGEAIVGQVTLPGRPVPLSLSTLTRGHARGAKEPGRIGRELTALESRCTGRV